MEKDTYKVGHSGRYPWGSGEKNKKQGLSIYRHKDGTLTKLGKRKAERAAKSYAKVTGKKLVLSKVKKEETNNNDSKNKTKNIKEMSTKEINDVINRIKAENELAKLTYVPKKENIISRIIKPIKSVGSNIIKPAITESGKSVLTRYLKDKGNEYLDSRKIKTPAEKLNDLVKESQAKSNIAKNRYNELLDNKRYDFVKNNYKKYTSGNSLEKAVKNYINNLDNSQRYTNIGKVKTKTSEYKSKVYRGEKIVNDVLKQFNKQSFSNSNKSPLTKKINYQLSDIIKDYNLDDTQQRISRKIIRARTL